MFSWLAVGELLMGCFASNCQRIVSGFERILSVSIALAGSAAMPLTDARNALFAPLGGDACIVLSLRDGKLINTLPVGADGNTSATPLVVDNLLLIPTRQGIVAFAPSSNGNTVKSQIAATVEPG